MFGWKKPSPPPATCPANPGKAVSAEVAFANDGRNWTENVNVLDCMTDALKSEAHRFAAKKSWIELEVGFVIQPRLVSLQPLNQRGVQTVTTIEVSHPDAIPDGVFEYQHATGDTVHESIFKGFGDWMRLDLPVFLDTIQVQPKFCAAMQFNFPATAARPARQRRILLGPVAHLLSRQTEGPAEEHPFCPCCLVTNTREIMEQQVAAEGFHGIRLFAMRQSDGSAGADCRVNGSDWEPGKAALLQYVGSWPDRGVEFRKQFVVVQEQPNPA